MIELLDWFAAHPGGIFIGLIAGGGFCTWTVELVRAWKGK